MYLYHQPDVIFNQAWDVFFYQPALFDFETPMEIWPAHGGDELLVGLVRKRHEKWCSAW